MLIFIFLTYATSWLLWFAASETPTSATDGILILLGTFAPGLVALALTFWTSGTNGVTTLLRRLIQGRVSARWYLFAIGYMAAIKLTVAVVYRGMVGTWPQFGDTPLYLMLAATLGSALLGGQAGEEIGWRGYALPRLARRFGVGPASVLLGMVWAAWHLPLFFFLPEADTAGQSFPLYLVQVTALSVAFAWVYARTQGSLLPVMLLHAAVNNTKDIVPSADLQATNPWALSHSLVGWLTAALLWAWAGYFLLRMRKLPPADLK